MNSEAEAERIPREMEEERTHYEAPWNCLKLKGHWVHLAGNKKTSSVCNISISCLYKADKALLCKWKYCKIQIKFSLYQFLSNISKLLTEWKFDGKCCVCTRWGACFVSFACWFLIHQLLRASCKERQHGERGKGGGGGGGKKGNTLQADTSSSQWRRHGGSSPFGATFAPRQMNSARQKRRRKQCQRRTETTTTSTTTTWRTKRKGTQQFGEGHVNFHYKQKLKGSRRMPYGHKLPRPTLHASLPSWCWATELGICVRAKVFTHD